MALSITSSAFGQHEMIPANYTADGTDVSPPLEWSGEPAETSAFVLICDDPDAPVGTWVHWVLYDIPRSVHQLSRGVPPQPEVPGVGIQGVNDFGKVGYGGPAPPKGKPHRYFFKLYALDRPAGLAPRASKATVLKAIEGRIIAEAELVGIYRR